MLKNNQHILFSLLTCLSYKVSNFYIKTLHLEPFKEYETLFQIKTKPPRELTELLLSSFAFVFLNNFILFVIGLIKIEAQPHVSKFCHVIGLHVAVSHFLHGDRVCLLSRGLISLRKTFLRDKHIYITYQICRLPCHIGHQ